MGVREFAKLTLSHVPLGLGTSPAGRSSHTPSSRGVYQLPKPISPTSVSHFSWVLISDLGLHAPPEMQPFMLKGTRAPHETNSLARQEQRHGRHGSQKPPNTASSRFSSEKPCVSDLDGRYKGCANLIAGLLALQNRRGQWRASRPPTADEKTHGRAGLPPARLRTDERAGSIALARTLFISSAEALMPPSA